jgi:hypothetical protein
LNFDSGRFWQKNGGKKISTLGSFWYGEVVRRKRILIILTACVLAGIGVVAFWPGPKEPEYNGKKLSEWLRAYELPVNPVASFEQWRAKWRAADEAVQHIGTNALPWLVRWIAYEPPKWKERIEGLVSKVPASTIPSWYYWDDALTKDAEHAFEVLGTNAAAAVPQLIQIVKQPRRELKQELAMTALSHVGKDGFPALLAALKDKDPHTKSTAAVCIYKMFGRGVDVSPAIPELLLLDREIEKSNPAAYPHYCFVPLFDDEPAFLIAALSNCLGHVDARVRVEAVIVLARLGDKARPVVPALTKALNDPAIAVQEAAIVALQKIAPEVLMNGVKDF